MRDAIGTDVKPYTENIVTFRMLHSGYVAAAARFAAAAKQRDGDASFQPLFEALNWAVALDDRIRAHWAPEGKPLNWRWRERVPGAELVEGLRWVRNGVHHQWSDALVLSEGFQFPLTFGLVFFEWVWRPAMDLPELGRPNAGGRTAYQQHLAGRPARVTLDTLTGVFAFLANLLEPTRDDLRID
jgi:hypothetical protein